MHMKPMMTIAPLLALLAVQDVSGPIVVPTPGRPQMTINANSPPGAVVDPPVRTTHGLLLADERKPVAPTDRSAPGATPPPEPSDPLDSGSNRDLERPQRASPEAANDLFQLLKQAGPKQGSKSK
jgi:hypothetical protein